MRTVTIIVLLVTMATGLAANDLGSRQLDKPTIHIVPPPADQAMIRQGGDTFDDAVSIPALPYLTTGTTTGFTDDYEWICPTGGSMSPDVVYSYVPAIDGLLRVDMCGSQFDTRIYVVDADYQLIECNEDYYYDEECGFYTSLIRAAPIIGGAEHFIIIDGYGSDHGDYVMEVSEYVPCEVSIPSGAMHEGEPPLEDGYLDAHNGGCTSPEFGTPFQMLTGDPEGRLLFAGRSGWYNDGYSRDTDWFLAEIGPGGTVEVIITTEIQSYFFELGPQDCDEVAVVSQWQIQECSEESVSITGEPGGLAWLWIGPTYYEMPDGWNDNEYTYLLDISGLAPGTVAVEARSWSGVKALFHH